MKRRTGAFAITGSSDLCLDLKKKKKKRLRDACAARDARVYYPHKQTNK